ncbi:hypothetical protein BS47DRAFT_1374691 [Hydnum rufescens UP504]|uniref:CCD97-like C-terminal domain-containing protein n=1 Tax=Hydnum rufescens UP504 TaxID=1448309 RepID=A0A9P6E0F3_9AGAM|nr:hypothetical protein BS47DRAFT_1374691 [Hydnum rufescens UP504]
MTSYPFDSLALTKYLGLPKDYTPRAESEPLQFLTLHLHSLPPHLLIQFSNILTPHQRASISLIKNRRTHGIRPGAHDAQQEREWTDAHFIGYNSPLPGHTKGGHVRKLGDLLAEYEEEREADRIRALRRERASQAAAERETQEEFDSDSEDDDDDDDGNLPPEEPESLEDAQRGFERTLRERFISGLLDSHLYDQVDYDDKWDPDSRDQEDSWFDDEEES